MIESILLIMLVCLVLHQLVMLRRLQNIKRHDAVLFRFCEIRRQVVVFIGDELTAEKLSRGDYQSARSLLNALNVIISDFHRAKLVFFNMRSLARILRQYEVAAGRLRLAEKTHNSGLQSLRERTSVALVAAFFAYTPMIRSEIALRILGLAVKRGWQNLGRQPREDARRLGVKIGWGMPKLSLGE